MKISTNHWHLKSGIWHLLFTLLVISSPVGADEYDDWCAKGKSQEEEGNIKQSIAAYKKALKIRPEGEKALVGLGKAYKLILYKAPKNRKVQKSYIETIGKTQDTLELKKTVDFILRKDKGSHYAFFVRGKIEMGEGDTAKAYESFRSAYIGQRNNKKYSDHLLNTIHSDKQIRRAFLFLKKLVKSKKASKRAQLLYLKGNVNKKKWTFAEKEYQKIYKKKKKWLYGLPEPIRMFHFKKKYKQAAELAKIYLKKNPDDKTIREILVKCYRKLEVKDKTLHRELTRLVEQDPETKKYWLELARLDASLGDVKSALKHGKIWVKRNPKSSAGYKFLLPFIAKNPAEKDTYIMALEKLIALEPRRSRNRRKELGLLRYDQGKYDLAARLLFISSKHFPKSHEMWYKLGMSRIKLNQRDKSEGAFKKAYRLKPDSLEYARRYGTYLESDKFIKANLKLFKLLEKNNPDINEQIKIAKSYSLNNDHTSASRIWKKLSEKDPGFVENNPMALADMAKAGQVSEVMKHSGAITDNFQVNLDLAVQMEKKGKIKEALGYYVMAYKLRRDDVSVILAMARLYGDQNEFSKGLDGYTRALKLKPRSKKIQAKSIALAKKSGNPAFVKSMYKVIIQNDPESHSSQFELGLIYFNEGNTDLALKKWKTALKLDPGNKTYSNAITHAEEEE